MVKIFEAFGRLLLSYVYNRYLLFFSVGTYTMYHLIITKPVERNDKMLHDPWQVLKEVVDVST